MKKITAFSLLLTSYFLLLTPGVSFAQTYPVSCPAEAQAIVNAVGGCLAVDKDLYSAIYDNCCVVSPAPSSMTMTLWILAVVVLLGLGIMSLRYYLRSRKNEQGDGRNL